MKRIAGLIGLAFLSITAYAVVASPEPFEFTQADGTTVIARLYGDEFHSYILSLDGELLEGSLTPSDEELVVQKRRMRRATQGPGNAIFPTTGSPRSLVLLVSFSDLPFGETHQDFQDLLTKSGYNHNGASGSCRDYYIASSDSIFQPLFDCYGPYTLEHTQEYYGGNSGTSNSVHAGDMIAEACQMAHADGVNFKDYDTNNDGLLDNVFVFYAGHNEAEGGGAQTIWPHQSNIAYKNVRLDGVLVNTYACTSEYKGASGKTRCGIGTFCHEFGHVIGLPDFYDTDYNYYSVGDWDIMCSGSYNNGGNTPPTFSAYERMYEGWLTPKQLELPGQYTLTASPFHKEAYLIAASTHNLSGQMPSPNEFFLLDPRSADDVWDKALPGHGLLVWHIDYSSSAWVNNTPNNGPTLMRMHLEEANGIGWKKRSNGEGGRSSDPYPGSSNVTSFTPVLHNGTRLAQPIFNIKENDPVISFTYISDSGSSLRATQEEIEITSTVSDSKQIVDWAPQTFELLGTGIAPDQPLTLTASTATFGLYAGEQAPDKSSNEWKRTIELNAQSDSTLQQRIWVCFRPTKQSCDITKGTLTVSSISATISLPLIGHAPRPTYVSTPVTLPVKDITPYSFIASWKSVEDAEFYYLTLYQLEEGTTEFKQDFENFTDLKKIHEQGWESNTTLTTTSTKAEGQRSLYFKNHGDQITSETYPASITQLSFWYSAFATTTDTIGVLEIEALEGDEWLLAEQLVVRNIDKRVTKTYEFTDEDDYRAFRLTWIDNGGTGMAFDAFVATASQKITYIHKGTNLAVAAFDGGETKSHIFTPLEPGSTYYYQVQCTDLDKGCEQHITELSPAVAVTTLNGEPIDSKKLTLAYDSINYNPATHAVYLINPRDGDQLLVYDTAGRLVQRINVSAGCMIYPLELSRFTRGEVYMIQHASDGKLKRKNKWVKVLF